eukprot:6181102-Pleurochrysis_carterae.AAC.2
MPVQQQACMRGLIAQNRQLQINSKFSCHWDSIRLCFSRRRNGLLFLALMLEYFVGDMEMAYG